ncbi:uncharacterized protein G6M90_00g076570 [Metarhizium brunneum]|uniref:Uncharacterized protein n=1 Tax=Metarhizium brunneum TaxID=500148 RepID=A0A7D5YSX5_9HYPO|nr:hypothetical protein G6M90_00g076570 [Metarhizium brunneum]
MAATTDLSAAQPTLQAEPLVPEAAEDPTTYTQLHLTDSEGEAEPGKTPEDDLPRGEDVVEDRQGAEAAESSNPPELQGEQTHTSKKSKRKEKKNKKNTPVETTNNENNEKSVTTSPGNKKNKKKKKGKNKGTANTSSADKEPESEAEAEEAKPQEVKEEEAPVAEADSSSSEPAREEDKPEVAKEETSTVVEEQTASSEVPVPKTEESKPAEEKQEITVVTEESTAPEPAPEDSVQEKAPEESQPAAEPAAEPEASTPEVTPEATVEQAAPAIETEQEAASKESEPAAEAAKPEEPKEETPEAAGGSSAPEAGTEASAPVKAEEKTDMTAEEPASSDTTPEAPAEESSLAAEAADSETKEEPGDGAPAEEPTEKKPTEEKMTESTEPAPEEAPVANAAEEENVNAKPAEQPIPDAAAEDAAKEDTTAGNDQESVKPAEGSADPEPVEDAASTEPAAQNAAPEGTMAETPSVEEPTNEQSAAEKPAGETESEQTAAQEPADEPVTAAVAEDDVPKATGEDATTEEVTDEVKAATESIPVETIAETTPTGDEVTKDSPLEGVLVATEATATSEDDPPSGPASADAPTVDAAEESVAREPEDGVTSTEESPLNVVNEETGGEAPPSTEPEAPAATEDAEDTKDSPNADSAPADIPADIPADGPALESAPESKAEPLAEPAEEEKISDEPVTKDEAAEVAEPEADHDAKQAEPESVEASTNEVSEPKKEVEDAVQEVSQAESSPAEVQPDAAKPDSQAEPGSDSAHEGEAPITEETKAEATATEAAADDTVKEAEKAEQSIEDPVPSNEGQEEPEQSPPETATAAAEPETEKLETVEDKPAEDKVGEAEASESADVATITEPQDVPSEPTTTESKPEEPGADAPATEAAEEVKGEEDTTATTAQSVVESAADPVNDDKAKTNEQKAEEASQEQPTPDESKPDEGATAEPNESEAAEKEPTESPMSKPDDTEVKDKDAPSAEAGTAEAPVEEPKAVETEMTATTEVAAEDQVASTEAETSPADATAEPSTSETEAAKEPALVPENAEEPVDVVTEPVTQDADGSAASPPESETKQGEQTEDSNADKADTKLDEESAAIEGPAETAVEDTPATENQISESQSEVPNDELVASPTEEPEAQIEETGATGIVDGAEDKPKPEESEVTKDGEGVSDAPAPAAETTETKEAAAETEVEESSDPAAEAKDVNDEPAAEQPEALTEQPADTEETTPVDDKIEPTDEGEVAPVTEPAVQSPDAAETEAEGPAEEATAAEPEGTDGAAAVAVQEQAEQAAEGEDSTKEPEATPETTAMEPATDDKEAVADTEPPAITTDEDNADADTMKEANEPEVEAEKTVTAPADLVDNSASEPLAPVVSDEAKEVVQEPAVDDTTSEVKPDPDFDAPHSTEEAEAPADVSGAEAEAPKEDVSADKETVEQTTDDVPATEEAKLADQPDVAAEQEKEAATVEAAEDAVQDKAAPESAADTAESTAATQDVQVEPSDPAAETVEPVESEAQEEPVPEASAEPIEDEAKGEPEADSQDVADIAAAQPVEPETTGDESGGAEPPIEIVQETTAEPEAAKESETVTADHAETEEAPDADETRAQIGSKDESEPAAEPGEETEQPTVSEDIKAADGAAETAGTAEAPPPESVAAAEEEAKAEELVAEVAEPQEPEIVPAAEVAEAEAPAPAPEVIEPKEEPEAPVAEEVEPEPEPAEEPKAEPLVEEMEQDHSKAAAAAIIAGIAAAAGGAALVATELPKDKPKAPKTPEEEESKDTVGPIPRDGKLTPKSKKGEELYSFHDTPSDFSDAVGYTNLEEAGERDGNDVFALPEKEEVKELRPATEQVLDEATEVKSEVLEQQLKETVAIVSTEEEAATVVLESVEDALAGKSSLPTTGTLDEVETEESAPAAEEDPVLEHASEKTQLPDTEAPEAVSAGGSKPTTEEQGLTKSDDLALAPAHGEESDQVAASTVLDDLKEQLAEQTATKPVVEDASAEPATIAAMEEPEVPVNEESALVITKGETPTIAEDFVALDDTKKDLHLQNEKETVATDSAILEPVLAVSSEGLSSSVTQEPILDDPNELVAPKAADEPESVATEALDTADAAPIVVDDTTAEVSVSVQVSKEVVPEAVRESASAAASTEEELPHAGEPILESTEKPDTTATDAVATVILGSEEHSASGAEESVSTRAVGPTTPAVIEEPIRSEASGEGLRTEESTLEPMEKPDNTAVDSAAINVDADRLHVAAAEVSEMASDQELTSTVIQAVTVDNATEPTELKSTEPVLTTGAQESSPGTEGLNISDEPRENLVEESNPLDNEETKLVNATKNTAPVNESVDVDDSVTGLAQSALESGIVSIPDADVIAKVPDMLTHTAEEPSVVEAEPFFTTKAEIDSVAGVAEEPIVSQVSTAAATIEAEPIMLEEVSKELDNSSPVQAANQAALFATDDESRLVSDKSTIYAVEDQAVGGNGPHVEASQESEHLDQYQELAAEGETKAESEDGSSVLIDNSGEVLNTDSAGPEATDSEKPLEDDGVVLSQEQPLSESWALVEATDDSKSKPAEEIVAEHEVQEHSAPDSEDNATVVVSQEIPNDSEPTRQMEAEMQEEDALAESLPDLAVETVVENKALASDTPAESSVGPVAEGEETEAKDQMLDRSAEQLAAVLAAETLITDEAIAPVNVTESQPMPETKPAETQDIDLTVQASNEQSRSEMASEMATYYQAVPDAFDLPQIELEARALPMEDIEQKDLAQTAADQGPVAVAVAEAPIEMTSSQEATAADSQEAPCPDDIRPESLPKAIEETNPQGVPAQVFCAQLSAQPVAEAPAIKEVIATEALIVDPQIETSLASDGAAETADEAEQKDDFVEIAAEQSVAALQRERATDVEHGISVAAADDDEEFVDASEGTETAPNADAAFPPTEAPESWLSQEVALEAPAEDIALPTATPTGEREVSSHGKIVSTDSSTEEPGSQIAGIALAAAGVAALTGAVTVAAVGQLHDSKSTDVVGFTAEHDKSLVSAKASETEKCGDLTEAQGKSTAACETLAPAAAELEVEPTQSSGLTIRASDVDLRAPTPAVVVPDMAMVDQQRNKSLKRKQKLAVRNVEDTVAAAVVIYATAEALSPPASPKAGDTFQDHEGEFPSVVSREIVEEDSHQLDTDLSADETSRDPRASSGERERERTRRRRQSSHQSSRSSREDASKTPPRTPRRRDSGVSGESSGSSGKRRTPEEKAEHERRRAERHLGDQDSERRERSEPSERSERSTHRDRKGSRDVDHPAERSHRSSRRHSHSSQHKSDRIPSASAPVEREPLIQPSDKRFFEIKNSEGIVGSGLPPTIAGETTVEVEIEVEAPRATEAPKRSNTTRSKYGFGRLSTDQSRPKTTKTRESADVPRGSSSKGSVTTSEDNARRARKSERSKKEEEKKPTGFKGVLKRIFG